MSSNLLRNGHLLWRAGFGPAATGLQDLGRHHPQKVYAALRKASAKAPAYLDLADSYLKGLMMGIGDAGRQARTLDAEERRMAQQKQRESLRNLNLAWMGEMTGSPAQLREKVALFWHGHFATRNLNVFYQQDLLHILRTGGLGSFRDLLHTVSKSAALLNFLNAQQNRKDHPNENFARELMELFTLGRGQYTEKDVKEAARAFTGWGANARGEFVFRRQQHDTGAKEVLGRKGNLTGEEVLDHILDQPATARFIARKAYQFFVNDTPDEGKVQWLADRYYRNGYDTGKLMDDIFTSDWFYAERHIGTRIKSPVELMVGIQRMLPMEVENEESLLLLQRVLGQVLFYPPNVAGWPGGKAWIDSSTLMTRLRLPLLLEAEDLALRAKADDDQLGGKPEVVKRKGMGARIDWPVYVKNFESVPRTALLTTMQSHLLLSPTALPPELLRAHSDESGRESFIRTATMKIMSLPEYQLC